MLEWDRHQSVLIRLKGIYSFSLLKGRQFFADICIKADNIFNIKIFFSVFKRCPPNYMTVSTILQQVANHISTCFNTYLKKCPPLLIVEWYLQYYISTCSCPPYFNRFFSFKIVSAIIQELIKKCLL